MECISLRIGGRVQGVGFRPFVFRLAHRLGVVGSVWNRSGEVLVEACGESAALDEFALRLVRDAPRISRPRLLQRRPIELQPPADFSIRESVSDALSGVHVPPDFFTCDDCLVEFRDPLARRYRYPFINCTQCGPRYTIIRELPYDRPATSMAGFALCADCEREYLDPLDRRFHAQPLACPVCGPELTFSKAGSSSTQDAMVQAIRELTDGAILAIRGVGGYHLVCDARNPEAIRRLRIRKRRPAKPFAIMVPHCGADGAQAIRDIAFVDDEQLELLQSPMRPIVLLDARRGRLASGIAPGLGEVGVMLPYSPLHHLLLEIFGAPLVATSGNVSGEPVLCEPAEVEDRLGDVADAFLHHDRPILRPADDPVFRRIGGCLRPLRLGRGLAPLELDLPFTLPGPVIAVGSHMKNTVALAWEKRMVVSPHIGDLGSPRGLEIHARTIEDLQRLYGVRASACVRDAHDGYGSAHWAETSGLPVSPVFHHRAHASALVLEDWDDAPWLVFTWDGVGLGEEGELWGGETLYGRPGDWSRVATFRSFRLPGGERAAREPWRCALALEWEIGRTPRSWRPVGDASLPDARDVEVLYRAWCRNINAPSTTAVGRLFDAAASLTDVLQVASHEGQGPMRLEQSSAALGPAPPLSLQSRDGLLVADWGPLVAELENPGRPLAERAARFHSRLAHTLLQIAMQCGRHYGVNRVGLCGGVFQNRLLTDYAMELLEGHGFLVRVPHQLPVNDAAISAGQVVEWAMQHTAPASMA